MLFALFLLVLPSLLNAEFTRLQWSDCGSPQISFNKIDATPMPIIQPGNLNLILDAVFARSASGKFKSNINIIRTVAGLALPIKCYLAQGINVGSCDYDDLCTVVEKLVPNSFNPTVCPPSLLDYGIDCRCPFNIRSGRILIDNVNLILPDASQSIATFLASGDFNITLKIADDKGSFACLNIKFTVKPFKPGK